MALALRKNGVNILSVSGLSGHDLLGGDTCSDVQVDWFEGTIDSSIQTSVSWESPPGTMTLGISGTGYGYFSWGDGSINEFPNNTGTNVVLHTYSVITTYTCRVLTNVSLQMTIGFGSSGSTRWTDVTRWGENTEYTGISLFFSLFPVSWTALDQPPPTATIFKDFMFSSNNFNAPPFALWTNSFSTIDSILKTSTAFNQDLSGWDVSNCDTFTSAFEECLSFNQDISGWNVSSGNTFLTMFDGATSFNQNLGAWTFNDGANLQYMFQNCSALTDANVALMLIGWDVAGQGENINGTLMFFLSTGFRSMAISTYPAAKAAFDNLGLATGSGGRGWSLAASGITWT